MKDKIIFIDRDGTLIEEPKDEQVDSIEKVKLLKNVIPSLLMLKNAGYKFIIVSNQDGLGTNKFPLKKFKEAHQYIIELFLSQGIKFDQEFFCPHKDNDNCKCRKPLTGLLNKFLANSNFDKKLSAVIGDRDTDIELATNLGIRGYKISDEKEDNNWFDIAHIIANNPRRAEISRATKETNIQVKVDLDIAKEPRIETGIGFFDHMLEQLGKHGGFALEIQCDGDLEIDEHHTVEDVAISIGEAIKEALGNKIGIERYGFVLPMDESEAKVSIDLGGRSYFVFNGKFERDKIGELPTELIPHFFESLSGSMGAAINIDIAGMNTHHMIEACFKCFARALKQAIEKNSNILPTTKGVL
ncbi:MAG: bifunctional histidinol-phosphatase/imidazoleglycerol-phosphate dehydratase HisB [Pseudomonadota bacterium]|nr:bifunctional histidinol-phosphatase/imidazoleglycerol-phosphate dehydratase HisB [Pseudomonadota bacterium]|tara:strand:+ start:1059 stop:2129 length:1071 start_codon:yes stop_codon:yes gene_type:complete